MHEVEIMEESAVMKENKHKFRFLALPYDMKKLNAILIFYCYFVITTNEG